MSKRVAEYGEESRDPKRTKTSYPAPDVVPATDIWSARQLQSLLSFSQDAVHQLRSGTLSCNTSHLRETADKST